MSLDAAQEYSVEIAASLEECFETVLAFERYPEWSSAIQSARVLERDKAGVGRVVEFHIDMKLRSVRYVLQYAHKKPTELTWHSVDGDIQSIEGRYQFRKLGPKTTRASCRQEVELGFWLPGPLKTLAQRTALKQSVIEFKAEVERRIAAAPTAEARRPKRKTADKARRR